MSEWYDRDAVISSDPDTKQITVIADDETAQYIKQVIRAWIGRSRKY